MAFDSKKKMIGDDDMTYIHNTQHKTTHRWDDDESRKEVDLTSYEEREREKKR